MKLVERSCSGISLGAQGSIRLFASMATRERQPTAGFETQMKRYSAEVIGDERADLWVDAYPLSQPTRGDLNHLVYSGFS